MINNPCFCGTVYPFPDGGLRVDLLSFRGHSCQLVTGGTSGPCWELRVCAERPSPAFSSVLLSEREGIWEEAAILFPSTRGDGRES